jgi:hypothetical protein
VGEHLYHGCISPHITSTMRLFYPDLLMSFLPIAPFLDDRHDNIFSRHERKLLRNPTRDNIWVYNKAFADVPQCRKDDVSSQERFRKSNPPVCTIHCCVKIQFTRDEDQELPVIKRPFKPLNTRGHKCILMQYH